MSALIRTIIFRNSKKLIIGCVVIVGVIILLYRLLEHNVLARSVTSNNIAPLRSLDEHDGSQNGYTSSIERIWRFISQFYVSLFPTPETMVLSRNESCQNCFPHKFQYLLNNKHICTKHTDSDQIVLLLAISTTHSHIEQRQALRKTWLTVTRNNTANVRHVFLLGETQDSILQKLVQFESDVYGDIVKEVKDFVDSYKNLTYKTIMAFKWSSNYCGHAHYVMKTDDDMFVHVDNILDFLKHNTSPTQDLTALYGACWSEVPIRDSRSKWYVPSHMYPYDHYPLFCSGTGYVASMRTIEKLYQISAHVPFFYLEDVYVGFCLKQINGTAVKVPGFFTIIGNADESFYDKMKYACEYKDRNVMTSHDLSPELLEVVWNSKC